MENENALEYCPICYKLLSIIEIENHVNKCIFLKCNEQKPKQKRCQSLTSLDQQTSTHNVKKEIGNLQTVPSTSNVTKTVGCFEPDKFPSNMSTKLLTMQMQPKYLNDFFGQDHILGKNTFLRALLDNNEIPSMILWGPPGCGKTSLANIINNICVENLQQYKYVEISAVDCTIKEIQNIITSASKEIKYNRQTVLFVDEIHRFNKRQQNILLVEVIKGNIILIGATTENPSFIMSDSFLNHCKVIVMEKLDTSHLIAILEKALAVLNINIIDDKSAVRNLFQNKNSLRIHRSAVNWLAETTDGDARIALNNLQLILQNNNENKLLTIANIKDGLKKSHLLYDRNGEEHHNIISAMHESIKGYNDNATLYWTARMLVGGEDPLFIARRLVRAASEDTGNADPKAISLAVSTMHGCELLGMPDCDVLLAQCAVYLARAPTTKQTKSALALAKQIISQTKEQPTVPVHLRALPEKLLKELGYEKENQSFMAAGLENVNFL